MQGGLEAAHLKLQLWGELFFNITTPPKKKIWFEKLTWKQVG